MGELKSKIVIERLDRLPVRLQKSELVERKGLGHPDYIIDAACESASAALSRYYLDHFGTILHHNLDKGLLVGGESRAWFGGGEVKTPIYILVAGRATIKVSTPNGVEEVPYKEIVENAVKDFLRKNFRFLDPEQHVVIDSKIRMGSGDRRGIIEREEDVPRANDTADGVGYAPLTPLEQLVYEAERLVNSAEFKQKIPESGEDCKVMGLRIENRYIITVADSVISTLTPDLDHYLSVKEQIKEEILKLADKILKGDGEAEVHVNTADIPGEGLVYLTVTGTSAESGDDGNTGRGNRVNGLITPNRQMSLEATAGKNAKSHVGKIYNVAAKMIAERIHKEIGKVEEVYVRLLSQIGRPINRPLITSIQFIPVDGVDAHSIAYEAAEIAKDELENITRIQGLVLEGKVDLF